MKATRDLVAISTEFAARVQHGEHNLGGAEVLVLVMDLHRDTPSIVADLAATVGQDCYLDEGAVTGHRLVD